jgi:hypothetical protein
MYDAIMAGARCTDSPTTMLLAREGYRVLLMVSVQLLHFASIIRCTFLERVQGARYGGSDIDVSRGEGSLDREDPPRADQQLVVTVLLPDGKEVVIEPKPHLQPLPELKGRVPEGWKDAVYARS